MLRSALLAALLAGASACTPPGDAPPADAPGDAVVASIIERSLQQCSGGAADAGIAALDSLIGAGGVGADVRATRGLCHWTRFAADSARADASAAFDDLSAAIEAARERPSERAPLDRLLSYRAFVRQALEPGDWAATIADLEAARAASPDEPAHRLDLGVARGMASDTARAVSDLTAFLGMVPAGDPRRRVAERLLEELGAEVPSPPSR